MMIFKSVAAAFALLLSGIVAAGAQTGGAQKSWPGQTDGDFVIRDYKFASGQTIAELKLHYTTIGTAQRDAAGAITNAVVLLHGTSSTGKMWLAPSLANELFAPGAPLDAANHYIILPDGIGRGGSSKPSDGLRGKFPNYRYADMVDAQYRLVTEALGVRHLRLVAGASMGGMQSWMWGGRHPDFMDALAPIASQPGAISGRNWLYRRIGIEAIRNDPDWNGGDYTKNPTRWAVTAPFATLMADSVVALQEKADSREKADAFYAKLVEAARKRDANDVLWATEAVMDYDPTPTLANIKARVVAINSQDDEINPSVLPTAETIARIPGARYVLIPRSPETHGHFTYLSAKLWKNEIAAVLRDTASSARN